MCVSRRESTLWNVRPRSFSPARSDPSVDSGPGSMIALSSADSIKSAAIDCGLPVQFRSIVVKVVIVSVVYQFSREHFPGSGNPVDARICLRNLGSLAYAMGTALCLFDDVPP